MELRALAPVAIAALFAASGCASEGLRDRGPTPAPVQAVVWNSCTNVAAGYTIDYPQEWHTNASNHLEECQVFDADPVQLPAEARDIAIDHGVIIRVEDAGFETVTSGDAGIEVVEEEQVEVDGRRAVRQELLATGETPYPEGTRSTRYAVDRDGQTLVAQAFDAGDLAYERKVQVLDEMVSELEFLGDE